MIFSRPQTAREALAPMNWLNWFFGIGIIEYPAGQTHPIFSACWSIVHLTMSLIFLKLSNLSLIVPFESEELSSSNYRTCIYAFTLLLVVCLLVGRSTAQNLQKFWRTLADANTHLKRLGIPNDYDLVFKIQWFELGFVFVLLSAVLCIDFTYIGVKYPDETSRINYLLNAHYLLGVAFVNDWSFSIGIRYMGHLFQRLNAHLLHFERRSGKSDDLFQDSCDSRHLFFKPSPPTLKIHRDCTFPKAERELEIVDVVRETRRIHLKLSFAAKEFNKVYSIQLLVSIGVGYLLCASFSYSIYIAVTKLEWKTTSTSTLMRMVIVTTWLTLQWIKMLLLIERCTETSSEAQKTGKMVHELLNRISEDEVRGEMRTFSLQLIQNPLFFNACGFFVLDKRFLCGMTNSMATFLIIMIQMRDMYEQDKETNSMESAYSFDSPNNKSLFVV